MSYSKPCIKVSENVSRLCLQNDLPMKYFSLILLLFLNIACFTGKTKDKKTDNTLTILSPRSNDRYAEGQKITFKIQPFSADSFVLYHNEKPIKTFVDSIVQIDAQINEKYGYQKFYYKQYVQGQITESAPIFIAFFPNKEPQKLSYTIIKQQSHNTTSYTQGLFYHQGILYESTGQYGFSKLIAEDFLSRKVLREHILDSTFFGEGACLFEDKIYQLTWRENTCFVYDKNTFQLLKKLSYPTEGWGLTTDGKSLIMSDGSQYIYFLDPHTLAEQRRIEVCHLTGFIDNINELEYIDGKIWANVYMLNVIIVIDPNTGNIDGMLDCTNLRRNEVTNFHAEVMNGIAYNEKDKIWYVTGKNWQYLYQIRVNP